MKGPEGIPDDGARGEAWKAPGPLVVFSTCGVSLEMWRDIGILDREMALYDRLRECFPEIVFVTYGGEEDCRIAEGLGFRALPNRSGMSAFRYSFLIPWYYRKELRRAAVLKTNQFDGAWAAAEAKVLFRRPLVARGGYLVSHFAEQGGWSRKGRWWARKVEKWSCRLADRVMVTAGWMGRYLVRKHGIRGEKVVVNPNFVDTEKFRPGSGGEAVPGRLGFVGRLEEQKNLDLLLGALKGLEGVELYVVGEGSLQAGYEEIVTREGLAVRFLGLMPNDKLPDFYRSCAVVVVPSLYEGHPKVVLEAMACGRPVVATDVDGSREAVRDGETGVLVELTEESLASGIRRVLDDEIWARELGRGARKYALQTFALDAVVNREADVYREILGVVRNDGGD